MVDKEKKYFQINFSIKSLSTQGHHETGESIQYNENINTKKDIDNAIIRIKLLADGFKEEKL